MKTFFASVLFFIFHSIFIIILSTNLHDAYAVSDPITESPNMSLGNLCKAVVTYSWDVSDIPGASQVRWELKKDSDFNNLESPEPDRIASDQLDGVQGSVTLDLRDFGQVLNGTKYYFRIVAKNNVGADVARRSDSAVFDIDITPQYTVQVDQQDLSIVNLSLENLQPDIEGCSDSLFYEVKRENPFVDQTGAEEDRIDQGPININTQNLQFEYPEEQFGTKLFFRIVGKYEGLGVNNDVGRRGRGKSVRIGVPVAEIGTSNPPPDAPFILKLRFYTDHPKLKADYALTNKKVFVQAYKTGNVTHIKAAECENFDDSSVQWIDYDGSTTVPKYFSFEEGGEKEICVQLLNKPDNATVGTFSNIKRASINIIKLVTHEIPFNRETITFIMENGYNFSGEPNTFSPNPCGTCSVAVDDTVPEEVLIVVSGYYEGCSCIFKFFENRATLNDPWEVDRFIILDNTKLDLNITRRPRENVIRTTIIGQVRVDPLPILDNLFGSPPYVSYDDFQLTLIGPEEADWRDAFRQ